MKVLFILKFREIKDPSSGQVYSYSGLSSGLLNSARMVKDYLNYDDRFEANLVQVVDNNDIDREVTKYRPDVVIIEAFWVVPEKFEVLRRLHPKVKWVIRNHSNLPFLAQEGIALKWVLSYVRQPNVYVGSNTPESLNSLIVAAATDQNIDYVEASTKFMYFPNYYIESDGQVSLPWKKDHVLDIGCFGAVRPLKNHLVQAVAALEFARYRRSYLRFHINVGRIESGGLPVLHNLQALFKNQPNAELVEHFWVPHAEFRQLVGTMDVALQVSLSETFNIVTADAVSMGVPVVGSSEVKWLNKLFMADPLDTDDIVMHLDLATRLGKFGAWLNRRGLAKYNRRSGHHIKYGLRRLVGEIKECPF